MLLNFGFSLGNLSFIIEGGGGTKNLKGQRKNCFPAQAHAVEHDSTMKGTHHQPLKDVDKSYMHIAKWKNSI